MRILIADDDNINTRLLEKILMDYGEVVVVDNGISAVTMASGALEEGQPFDLICLDIMMTKLDGYKTLQAIRDAEATYGENLVRRAKIIMISAFDEDVLQNIQVCSDYNAYVCKPIIVESFRKTIEKLGFIKNRV